MVMINMKKPNDCTGCPICSYEDDECLLQTRRHRTWEEQYEQCPMVEVKAMSSADTKKGANK